MTPSIERKWVEGRYDCLVVRHATLGHLCGYVRVPEDHPWHGLGYDDEVPGPPKELDDDLPVEQAMDDHGPINVFIAMLEGVDEGGHRLTCTLGGQCPVHGGLTFAGRMDWLNGAPGWWIGFDCAHAGDAVEPDYMPEAMIRVKRDLGHPLVDEGEHVWTVDEVALECSRIVAALTESEGSGVRQETRGLEGNR